MKDALNEENARVEGEHLAIVNQPLISADENGGFVL